jgi:poly(A) polymerase
MKLDPAQHAWMRAPETLAVLAALGEARFVGGAVRNALLGTKVSDIDIAVPFEPNEAVKKLEAAHIKVVPTGIEHGTVTAIHNGHVFEVTSLRRDVATDGRRAVVAYTGDWREDSARRDFTINALYAAPEGEIFDYHGGIEDLQAGRVRFVGDPVQRVAEDYLRILRLFRFHAWYGKGEMDGEALHAAAAAKEKLSTLSGERIAKELLRLLEAQNPMPVLRVMAASGILPQLLPGALALGRLDRLVMIETQEGMKADPVLRLMALLPRDAAGAVAERLRLSNADRTRFQSGLGDGAALAGISASAARGLLYHLGPAAFRDQVMLQWAGMPPDGKALPWRLLLTMTENWQRPKFPLTGADVMEAGIRQGPGVGEMLEKLERWWIEGDFSADETAIRARLAELLAQS